MSSTRQAKRDQWVGNAILTALLLVISVVVLYISGYGRFITAIWEEPTISVENYDIGHGITVSGAKVPASIKATPVQPDQVQGYPSDDILAQYAESVTPIFDIGPSGKLQAPMLIHFKLEQAMAPEDFDKLVVLSNYSHTADGWRSLPYEVSADGTTVNVTVDHLSWHKVVNFTNRYLEKFEDFLTDNLLEGMSPDAFANAERPTCPNEPKALGEGYDITADFGDPDTAFYCFGKEDNGDRIVRFVNNRPYPLEVTLSNLTVIDDGGFTINFAELYYKSGSLIIMPREEITLRVEPLPEDGGRASLKAELSKPAMLLDTLSIVFDIVVDGGSTDENGKAGLLTSMMLAKDCFNAFDPGKINIGGILQHCFNQDILSTVLGSFVSGILHKGGIIFSGAAGIDELAQAIAHRNSGSDRYEIEVTRFKVAKRFVGEWTRQFGWLVLTLTINADGTGALKTRCIGTPAWSEASCPSDYPLSFTPTDDGKGVIATNEAGMSPPKVNVRPGTEVVPGDQSLYVLDDKYRLRAQALGRRDYLNYEPGGRFYDNSKPGVFDATYLCSDRTPESARQLCHPY